MEYTQLGRTGLKVSRLCLGTMNFGPKTTEEDSFAIMDKAHELGIDFFDTANVYGRKLGRASQNRSSVAGLRRVADGVRKRSLQRRSLVVWAIGTTKPAFRH